MLLTLSGLGTSAFFFAQGTTELAASKLLAVEIPTGATQRRGGPPVMPPGAQSRRNRSSRDIMARNIFQPPSDVPVSTDETAPGQVMVYEPGQEPACAAEFHLVGAMANSAMPDWSYAALIQGTGPARLYRTNMQFGGMTLTEVSSHRVLLTNGAGSPCQIQMFAPDPPPGQAAAPALANTAAAAPLTPTLADSQGDITPAEMDAAITRESDTRFSVQRGLLDRALSQQESIFRTARLVPHQENGQTVGMRVYGIRRSSLLGRLGVQNGDMLRSMNGFDLNDADAMLTALGRLRTASDLSLSVVRRGSPVTIDYSVR
jgi:general secretion pathway protein C